MIAIRSVEKLIYTLYTMRGIEAEYGRIENGYSADLIVTENGTKTYIDVKGTMDVLRYRAERRNKAEAGNNQPP